MRVSFQSQEIEDRRNALLFAAKKPNYQMLKVSNTIYERAVEQAHLINTKMD